jgi:hypothetical protein
VGPKHFKHWQAFLQLVMYASLFGIIPPIYMSLAWALCMVTQNIQGLKIGQVLNYFSFG